VALAFILEASEKTRFLSKDTGRTLRLFFISYLPLAATFATCWSR
jgi:hypothetical protein